MLPLKVAKATLNLDGNDIPNIPRFKPYLADMDVVNSEEYSVYVIDFEGQLNTACTEVKYQVRYMQLKYLPPMLAFK